MKETFFFSHDYNARNDRKMLRLKVTLKMCGVGIYWSLIEMLYEEGGALFLSDIEVIADELRTDPGAVTSVINDFDLFKNNGEKFWSESVLSRLDKRQEKSKKASLSANKRWGDANAMPTHTERNAKKESKVKDNKEKDIKVDNTPDEKIIPITRHADEEQEEKEKNVAAKKESLAILQMAGAPCLDPLYEITWIELCDQPNFLSKRRQQLERLAMDLQEYDEGYAIELMKKAIRDDSKAVIWPNTKSDYQNHLKKLNHGTIKKFNNADTQAARKQGLADLEDLADRILAGAKS